METNSSLKSRNIVGLDDCSVLGTIADVVVDEETRMIDCFLVNEAEGKTKRALPFDKVISIGDAFVVIQSAKDFAEKKGNRERKAFNGFQLVGCVVYKKTGDKVGKITSYEFDPVFGAVTTITTEEGVSFTNDQFIFFAPKLVFVHDGSPLFTDIREQGENAAKDAAAEPEVEQEPEQDPAEKAEDEQLAAFLIGNIVTEDVESADGSLKIEKGTELTEELVKQAQELDMLIALTMSVE